MDEFFGLRAEMEAAIRQDDAARDRYDRFERKWAERERAQAPREIIRKTHTPPPQQRSAAAAMDDESSRQRNAWFHERVDKYFAAYSEELNKELDAIFDENEKLRAEIGQLRAELNLMTKIQSGEIAQIKGKAADAA